MVRAADHRRAQARGLKRIVAGQALDQRAAQHHGVGQTVEQSKLAQGVGHIGLHLPIRLLSQ